MSAGNMPRPTRNPHGCCADKACTDQTCMELPVGKTCGDCRHFNHCTAFYAHKASDTYCDFYPRRFADRVALGAQRTSKTGGV